MTVLPDASSAERGVSVGLPDRVKNTAVNTSVGTIVSRELVLANVRTRLPPRLSKLTLADRLPALPTNNAGPALAARGTAKIAAPARSISFFKSKSPIVSSSAGGAGLPPAAETQKPIGRVCG